MILCRLFIGFTDVTGKEVAFESQGQEQTVYVIDELAIKGFGKHADIHTGGSSSKAVASEFREVENYTAAEFIDKLVKPIILQEHFGVRTNFSFEGDGLEEFAKHWMVAVNVPDAARSIPDGATGVLVPRPYEGAAPTITQVHDSIDNVSASAENP